MAELRDCRTGRSISLRLWGCNKKIVVRLRDGNDLAGETVNADNHRFAHRVNFADRFAAKSHAPEFAFVFDRLDRLDAFRFEVNTLAGDLDGAFAADLLPRSLLALRGRRVCLSADNGEPRRQIGADQNCGQQIEHTLSVLHNDLADRRLILLEQLHALANSFARFIKLHAVESRDNGIRRINAFQFIATNTGTRQVVDDVESALLVAVEEEQVSPADLIRPAVVDAEDPPVGHDAPGLLNDQFRAFVIALQNLLDLEGVVGERHRVLPVTDGAPRLSRDVFGEDYQVSARHQSALRAIDVLPLGFRGNGRRLARHKMTDGEGRRHAHYQGCG